MKLKALLEKILDFSAISRDQLAFQVETGDPEEILRNFHRERLPGVAESLHEFFRGDLADAAGKETTGRGGSRGSGKQRKQKRRETGR